jgi:HK97 family phage portal protein
MGGWEFDPVRIMAEESQFLQTIDANATDVCRFFGVSPEDIGASSGGSSVTYANVEMRQIHLLVRTIGPWVIRLERRLSRLRPPGREVRFDLTALLRTDEKSRNAVISEQVRSGRLSVNEARYMEDLPDIGSDGDRYVWPPYRMQLSLRELEDGADQLSPTGTDDGTEDTDA